jgi:hypothetical protein
MGKSEQPLTLTEPSGRPHTPAERNRVAPPGRLKKTVKFPTQRTRPVKVSSKNNFQGIWATLSLPFCTRVIASKFEEIPHFLDSDWSKKGSKNNIVCQNCKKTGRFRCDYPAFCTLRVEAGSKRYYQRTPAMTAGLIASEVSRIVPARSQGEPANSR